MKETILFYTVILMLLSFYTIVKIRENKLYKAAIYLQIENTNLKQDKYLKRDKIMQIEGFFPDKNYEDCIKFKKYYFKK